MYVHVRSKHCDILYRSKSRVCHLHCNIPSVLSVNKISKLAELPEGAEILSVINPPSTDTTLILAESAAKCM